MQLADFGAEVIKVEHPARGDETRHWGPPFNAQSGNSAYFESVNRGKQSVALDFSHPRGANAAQLLAQKSDVIVENFLPGVLQKYKLDYASVRQDNPNVVYCSITGYGQSGAWSKRAGYDFIIQGESGLTALGGEADGRMMKTGVAVCDVLAGLNAAQAVLAALFRRRQTGQGAHIDISLLDCAASALVNVAQAALQTGQPAARFGNHHPHIVPYGDFFAKDEPFNLAIGNDRQFAALCDILHKKEWPAKFGTNPQRVGARETLIELLNEEFKTRCAAHWIELCAQNGIPAGRVCNIADTLHSDHARHRQLWRQTPAGKLMTTPLAFRGEEKSAPSLPPALGRHTVQVLQNIAGLSEDQIKELQKLNIIAKENENERLA